MKQNKGFTLIELLAVIVILAIIALIATPTILGVIDKAKKGAAESSALGYIDAIEKHIAMSMLDDTKYPKLTTNDVEELNDIVKVKGKSPVSGTIEYDNSRVLNAELCINGYNVEYDGKAKATSKCSNIPVVKENISVKNRMKLTHRDTYSYESSDEDILTVDNIGNISVLKTGTAVIKVLENEVIIKKYTVEAVKTSCEVINRQVENTLSIGDEVQCATESFYVYKPSDENGNIKMLSKYNLKVGGEYNGTTYVSYSESDPLYNMQDENMKGYVQNSSGSTIYPSKGTTIFGTTTIYSGSIVKRYTDTYKAKLEGIGVNVENSTLITKQELLSLGCKNAWCNPENGGIAPAWVYSTSYWSASECASSTVWLIGTVGYLSYAAIGDSNRFGVRPVIVISPDEI